MEKQNSNQRQSTIRLNVNNEYMIKRKSLIDDMQKVMHTFKMNSNIIKNCYQYIRPIIIWLILSFITGILFYDSLLFSVIIFMLCPIYIKRFLRSEKEKEERELEVSFKDALQGLSSALEAGYSVENSINEAVRDLKLIYSDSSRIIKEFEFMENQIKNNLPTETVFQELAKRCRIEDIESFSEIIITAKKTGGDIVKIIKSTSSAISEKSEVLKDIQTTISGKKYEATIMKSIPYLILLYFRVFSPEYLSVFYDGINGAFLMTLLLCLYLMANYITERIISIKV